MTNNRRAAEAEAHKLATKIAKRSKGEWFKLDIEQAKNYTEQYNHRLRKDRLMNIERESHRIYGSKARTV